MLWWFAACGSPSLPQSSPTPPTRSFEGAGAGTSVTWTELEDLLPATPLSLPNGLAGLAPRMNGGEARRVLEAAHQPGAKILGEAGTASVALGSILAQHPNVTATLILDREGAHLLEVDLALPRDEALSLLIARWGEPSSIEMLDGARAVHRWSAPPGSPWRAELQPEPFAPVAPGIPGVHPKKALLRYLPAEGETAAR
ncbi:MAG: hypothetical protein ABMA64_18025 [Myxococcota bacterium]